jgi:hypothetical protein
MNASIFIERAKYEYYLFWDTELNKCNSLEDVKKLPVKYRPDLIVTRVFDDGSWIVAVTTGIDQRKTFNAALLHHSNHDSYIINRDFSGFEVLYGEIEKIKAKNFSEFFKKAEKLQLVLFRKKNT